MYNDETMLASIEKVARNRESNAYFEPKRMTADKKIKYLKLIIQTTSKANLLLW